MPEREAFVVRLPADLARRLRIRAAEERTSMARIVERALRRELGEMLTKDEFGRELGYADYEALTMASERVAVEGDTTWYITRLPSGEWAAWDDAEISLDRVTRHRSREAALWYQWDGWQQKVDNESETVRWLGEIPGAGEKRDEG